MSLTATEEAQTRELLAQQAAILSLASNEATISSKLGATKVNLSQLPAASAVADADIMLVRQGSTDKGSALSILKAWVLSAVGVGFAISLLTNGYIKFPSFLGGLIIQWGSTSSGSSQDTVTFPIPFPSSVFNIQSVIKEATTGITQGVMVDITSILLTGCVVTKHYVSNGGTVGGATQSAYWMAIGV